MKVARATHLPANNELAIRVKLDDANPDEERVLVVDESDRIVGLLLPARETEGVLFRQVVARLNGEE